MQKYGIVWSFYSKTLTRHKPWISLLIFWTQARCTDLRANGEAKWGKLQHTIYGKYFIRSNDKVHNHCYQVDGNRIQVSWIGILHAFYLGILHRQTKRLFFFLNNLIVIHLFIHYRYKMLQINLHVFRVWTD